MPFDRSCGILLHPTSLPGRFGIGGIGSAGRHFVDFLEEAGQSLWQVCPLGPTGFGDSPYQCFSAFAGNPYLIDIEALLDVGLLETSEVEGIDFTEDKVEYGPLIEWKVNVLQKSFENFRVATPEKLSKQFSEFKNENSSWLEDFALFMALKDEHGGAPWVMWDKALIAREAKALKEASQRLNDSIEQHRFFQFLFFSQWGALKNYANKKGIQIIGDLPIFVAHDSADAWANQQLFHLKKDGMPKVVAGVPPDYFSETGQLWGNPLYRWNVMAKDQYAWWADRFNTLLKTVDIIRIDHFRGFDAYWEVPASEATAINGKWVKGPGKKFFNAMKKTLGALPIIAEDLGVITPEVEALRDQFGFPGMKVLQFAFGDEGDHDFLPHNYHSNCVVYTGTHDNDTTCGWYPQATDKEKDAVRRYLWVDGSNINWDFLRLAFMSVADIAVVPLQDALGLGSEARMNFPGRPDGNWLWRVTLDQITGDLAKALHEQAELTNRLPKLTT